MQYLAFKLMDGVEKFEDAQNDIYLSKENPYGMVPTSQLTNKINSGLSNKSIIQVPFEEYYKFTSIKTTTLI